MKLFSWLPVAAECFNNIPLRDWWHVACGDKQESVQTSNNYRHHVNERARTRAITMVPSLRTTDTRSCSLRAGLYKNLSPRAEDRRRFNLSGEWTDLAACRRLHLRHISTQEIVYILPKLCVDFSPLSSVLRCICPSDNHAGCSSGPCSGSPHW